MHQSNTEPNASPKTSIKAETSENPECTEKSKNHGYTENLHSPENPENPKCTENSKNYGNPENLNRPENPDKPIDLDYVLVNEIGEFGRFQMFNSVLVFISMFFTACVSEYIFGAAAIPHRCRIPECGEDTNLAEVFKPDWVLNAVPASSVGTTGFASCRRYVAIGNGTLDNCPSSIFNKDVEVECDSFVYARNDSVVYEFNLGCQEWMRTMAGTFNQIGTLLVLPFIGHISDRYGRRVAVTVSSFGLGLFGFLRAFSVNYPMYLVLQLLQTSVGTGIFTSAYIYIAETVGPKWRVAVCINSINMFAQGSLVFGAVAWALNDWRLLLLAFNIPQLFLISYYWILSENVRWLLCKEKFEEAKVVLKRIAKVNGKQISEESLAALMTPAPAPVQSSTENENSMVKSIFKSPILLRRVLTTPVWWLAVNFIYYGLYINSAALSEKIHLNFILTALFEIPGNYGSILLLNRIGRRATLSGGFILTAMCMFAFAFVPGDYPTVRLVLFLIGKMGASLVFPSVMQYSAELYPTPYRHRLISYSSMIGKLGSIAAPLTPALTMYWSGFPAMLFGTMGLIAGVLVLTQPETMGQKMPDTLEEAEALGTSKS